MNQIQSWYSNPFIHYNIAPFVYKRTFDVINTERLIKQYNEKHPSYRYRRASNPSGVKYWIDKFQVIEKPYNLYCSNALINIEKFPIMTLKKKDAKEQLDFIRDNFSMWVIGYDLTADLDNPDLQLVHSESSTFKYFYDNRKIPYSLKFTGNKGFNFRIDDSDVPAKYDRKKLPEINKILMENIGLHLNLSHKYVDSVTDLGKKTLVFDCLDLSVYQYERVFKIDYSIAREKNLVALPLSDIQFNNFLYDMKSIPDYMTPAWCLKNVYPLMNRGLLKRPGSKKAVEELYKEFYEDKIQKHNIVSRIKSIFN